MTKLNRHNREQFMEAILAAINEKDIFQFRDYFLELHPSDQLEVFITFSKAQRQLVYMYISPEEMAEIFGGLPFQKQKLLFNELDKAYAFNMFNHMFTDDIAAFLSKADKTYLETIIKNLDETKAEKVINILSYEPETAGAVMTNELISIAATDTVQNVLKLLRNEARDAEIVYYLYVVDEDGELAGVLTLKRLIMAEPEELVKDIMNTRVISVPENLDQEEVGKLIKKYDFLAVPVVSQENTLLGIITVDDIMDIMELETTEDFGEISAVKGATDINLGSIAAAKKRSPWIVLLMFFGMITAGVIGWFEDTLESVVLLGAFIPMLMDSAGNVGTQSLTVSVRGLAVGAIDKKGSFKIIRKELGTGFIIGLLCMIIVTLLITLLYDQWLLGLVVGISILLTHTLSAAIGATLPLFINKLNIDPAVASGPFITTLNDITGLLIYFSIATILLDIL